MPKKTVSPKRYSGEEVNGTVSTKYEYSYHDINFFDDTIKIVKGLGHKMNIYPRAYKIKSVGVRYLLSVHHNKYKNFVRLFNATEDHGVPVRYIFLQVSSYHLPDPARQNSLKSYWCSFVL